MPSTRLWSDSYQCYKSLVWLHCGFEPTTSFTRTYALPIRPPCLVKWFNSALTSAREIIQKEKEKPRQSCQTHTRRFFLKALTFHRFPRDYANEPEAQPSRVPPAAVVWQMTGSATRGKGGAPIRMWLEAFFYLSDPGGKSSRALQLAAAGE